MPVCQWDGAAYRKLDPLDAVGESPADLGDVLFGQQGQSYPGRNSSEGTTPNNRNVAATRESIEPKAALR
jgi:hypothetical protein